VFASPDELPPKIFKENGELKGTYVDIVREICRRLKLEPEFQQFPWARAISMAKSGRVDALFPPLKTPERLVFLYFPEEEIGLTRNIIFARKKRGLIVKKPEDLKHLVVGINDQYSYGKKFDAFKKDLTLDSSINEEMQIYKLASENPKRIDVAVASEEAFLFKSKKLGYSQEFEAVYVFSESPSYIAFSKAKGEKAKILAEKFSTTIRQLKKEGFIRKISDKYLN